jgi:hypothetical protein
MPSFSQAGYYLNTGAGKIKKKKSLGTGGAIYGVHPASFPFAAFPLLALSSGQKKGAVSRPRKFNRG